MFNIGTTVRYEDPKGTNIKVVAQITGYNTVKAQTDDTPCIASMKKIDSGIKIRKKQNEPNLNITPTETLLPKRTMIIGWSLVLTFWSIALYIIFR